MKDLHAEILELFEEEAPTVFSRRRWPAGFRMKTPNDPEWARLAQARWKVAHPELVGRWKRENPERNREHAAKYRAAHREELNAKEKLHPERNRKRAAKYRAAHREEVNARERARRAAKKALLGRL